MKNNKYIKIYAILSTVGLILLCSYIIYIHHTYNLFIDKEQKEIIDNFNDIALGAENGGDKVISKWESPIKMYIICDSGYTWQMEFLKNTIEQINQIQPDYLTIEITEDKDQSNSKIIFCKYENLENISQQSAKNISENYRGYFNYNYKNYIIHHSEIFINTSYSADEQKNAIVEEVVQSLGLGCDIMTNKESLFYQKKYDEKINCHSISDFDGQIIQLLYNPKILPGINRRDTEKILAEIIR